MRRIGLIPGRMIAHSDPERISFACMDRDKAQDARIRGHDSQEVIPAKAGIQQPYRSLQAALGQLCQAEFVRLIAGERRLANSRLAERGA